MTKRILAGLLWAYFALYAWNLYSGLAGINWLWGPLVFSSLVALVCADRVRRQWATRVADVRSVAAPSPTSAADPA